MLMQEFPEAVHLSQMRGFTSPQIDLLRAFAVRYIWWKTPDEALFFPERIVAQVMTLGTYEDLGRLEQAFSANDLWSVIRHAEPGWFNERAWAFWHVHLGLIPLGSNPPPLPVRTFT
jgi:hypothetical protein